MGAYGKLIAAVIAGVIAIGAEQGFDISWLSANMEWVQAGLTALVVWAIPNATT